jgi:hypothetical protein
VRPARFRYWLRADCFRDPLQDVLEGHLRQGRALDVIVGRCVERDVDAAGALDDVGGVFGQRGSIEYVDRFDIDGASEAGCQRFQGLAGATRQNGVRSFTGAGDGGPDRPAGRRWSIIAYDLDTNAFISNPRRRPPHGRRPARCPTRTEGRDHQRVGISSYDKDALRVNDDGTVDVYIGPNPPDDYETNWIPTEYHDFWLIARFYGPEPRLFDSYRTRNTHLDLGGRPSWPESRRDRFGVRASTPRVLHTELRPILPENMPSGVSPCAAATHAIRHDRAPLAAEECDRRRSAHAW